ncbi:hypothetical protein YQE_05342, partial [Dendroctonus ponderosae]
MDFTFYANSDALLIETSSTSSKESWALSNGIVMDSGEEYFGWNALKNVETAEGKPLNKKRKISSDLREDQLSTKQPNIFKLLKDPLELDQKLEAVKKVAHNGKGSTRMPSQWNVEDYGDIQQEIDNSLNLDADLSANHYSSESKSAMNSLMVFKQEALSPTMNEVAHSQARHNRQSPTSTQKGAMVNPINSTMEENSQNMFNSTINQLLSQSALVNLHSVIDNNNLSTSPHSQDNFGVSSTNNYSSLEDCRFQYVLAAATSIATKQNEDTLTYLNQGQSYEVKLKKLGDLSMYRGKLLKVNCISTEFTPKKHGGEKGVPFRIQVETYQNGDALTANKRLHAAACQIKVFKLKGADRKHKQDRDKIMKRPMAEQEKYQPSFECTVLNDVGFNH